MKLMTKGTNVQTCLCVFTSAAMAGGLLAKWLRASGHSGGSVAGAAGGDASSFRPILRVFEAMRRLLCRRSLGVRSLAHAHAHHGGICLGTHTLYSLSVDLKKSKWMIFVFRYVCAADENFFHEARAHRAALRWAQPVWVQVIKQPFWADARYICCVSASLSHFADTICCICVQVKRTISANANNKVTHLNLSLL